MDKKYKLALSGGILFLLVFAGISLALAALQQHRQDLSGIPTDTTDIDAGYPAVAISYDGDRLGAVWAEGASIQGKIYFRGADVSDAAFVSGKKVVGTSALTGKSLTPDIAADPNHVDLMHLVWKSQASAQGEDWSKINYITHTVSTNLTDSEIAVTEDVNNTETLNSPAIALSDNGVATGVHVVWQYNNINGVPATEKIYYRGSGNGGRSFAAENIVSGPDTGVSRPAIAVSNGYAHVVWVNDTDGDNKNEQIRYARGQIGGGGTVTAWSAPQTLTTTETSAHPDYPAIAAANDVVMVMWDAFAGDETAYDTEPADDQYYALYVLSDDNGSSFAADSGSVTTALRSDNNPAQSGADYNLRNSEHVRRLQIQAAAEVTTTANIDVVVHALWHRTVFSSSNYLHDIFYGRYLVGNCGEACGYWFTPVDETDGYKVKSNAYSASPDIAVANGVLHAAYMESDTEGGYDPADTLWNVYYNNSNPEEIVADENPKIFLPLIMKKNS